MNSNKGILDIFKIIPIILFLFGSMSALSIVYNTKVSWVVYGLLCLTLLLTRGKMDWNLKMNNPANAVFLFMLVTVCAYCVIYFSIPEIYSAILLVLTLLTSLAVTKTISFKRFLNTYLTTLRVLCIIALFFHFISVYLHIMLPHNRLVNVNGMIYYNWWINVMLESYTGDLLHRIMSIFWEPGIFASFLVLGLVFEFRFVDRKVSILNVILFIVCIYFTYSTAGYLLFAVGLCYIFFKSDNRVVKGILAVLFIILVFLFIIGYEQIMMALAKWNYEVFYKFVEKSGSFSTRIFAYEIEWDILKSSGFIGAGLNGGALKFEELRNTYSYTIGARTSTSMMYISSYGAAGLVYTIALALGCFKKSPGIWVEKLMFTVLMMIIVNKEPHLHCLASTCILFYMLDSDTVIERESVDGPEE